MKNNFISNNKIDIAAVEKLKVFYDEEYKIQEIKEFKLENLKYGDHLSSSRGLYHHHGIYVGADSVIHYSGFSKGISKGKIEATTVKGFHQGKKTHIVVHDCNYFNRDEIVRRALSKIGEDKYNLFLNNCEHFAYWCITGKSVSPQIDSIKELTLIAAELLNEHSIKGENLNKCIPLEDNIAIQHLGKFHIFNI